MRQGFQQRFDAILSVDKSTLSGGMKGIEKESLRVDEDGGLAQTDHPAALGSALTNAFITTDYSEALLEFITPALSNTWEVMQSLCDIHQFTYARLEGEMLWTSSMPCSIPDDDQIPLARYGRSNVGQMKTIYRRGLGYRYGRTMQTIAGVHFNYSLPQAFWPAYQEALGDSAGENAFRSEHYLGLVRNFRRFGWLVLYLFGASPAMCRSFTGGDDLGMPSLNNDTLYAPFGTSLRMSDLGYSNQNQARINISLNNLDAYVRDLSAAIETPEPAYQEIGVQVDGIYRQLNANQLQIENEYYSSVRPKRVAHSGERPTAALQRGGVEYVEIRSLDTSFDDPCGISQNTMRFVEAFLIYCLLEESPALCHQSLDETKHNQTSTAKRGREPGFELMRDGEPVLLVDWASEIIDDVAKVAAVLDEGADSDCYQSAVTQMQSCVDDAAQTPSAKILDLLTTTNKSFFEVAYDNAERHRDYFASIATMPTEREQRLIDEAESSLARQREIEAADEISLDEYLARYFS
ncbi:MAG: glutamate--cysteine ligase [Pseudomonadota bacterium]